jgi:hypothetical protein
LLASWNDLLMRTFFARCGMLGVLASGFMLTGDAGRVIARGTSLLNATNLPTTASEPSAATPPAEAVASAGAWTTAPVGPASMPPPVETIVHPTLAAPPVPPPADGGLAAIDLRLLRAGDRLLVWVRGTPTVFDIVDPSAGEVLQQPQPRRVRISGPGDLHRLVRGGMVHVQPAVGISGHSAPAEQLGPVQAIAVK